MRSKAAIFFFPISYLFTRSAGALPDYGIGIAPIVIRLPITAAFAAQLGVFALFVTAVGLFVPVVAVRLIIGLAVRPIVGLTIRFAIGSEIRFEIGFAIGLTI